MLFTLHKFPLSVFWVTVGGNALTVRNCAHPAGSNPKVVFKKSFGHNLFFRVWSLPTGNDDFQENPNLLQNQTRLQCPCIDLDGSPVETSIFSFRSSPGTPTFLLQPLFSLKNFWSFPIEPSLGKKPMSLSSSERRQALKAFQFGDGVLLETVS